MKIVDIKQIETRLSEYVRLVQAGETVLIAEHDKIVTELHPVRRRMLSADRLEELLDGLATWGELTRAVQPKGRWTWRSRGLGLPSGTAQGLLDELRGS